MSTLKRILSVYSDFKKPVIVIAISLIISQSFQIFPTYLFGEVINGTIAQKPIGWLLFLIFAGFVSFLIDRLISNWRAIYEIRTIVQDVEDAVSKETMRHMFSLSVGQTINRHSGLTQSVINRGMNSLTNFIRILIFNILPTAVTIIVLLIILTILYPEIGSVVFVSVVVLTIMSIRSGSFYGPKIMKHQDIEDDIGKHYSEQLRNMADIQLASEENHSMNDYCRRIGRSNKYFKCLWVGYIKSSALRDIILVVTRALVLLLGVWLVYEGRYEPGALVVMVMWSNHCISNTTNITRYHRQTMEMLEAIKKYFGLLDIKPAITTPSNAVCLPKIKGEIEFRNVSFSYPKNGDMENRGDTILQNISFSIKAGEHVAFVGPSGAGKTTIFTLLVRGFDPDEGEILIDGVPLTSLDLERYRSQIGYVPQRTSLFDRSLGWNLRFGTNGHRNVGDKVLHEILQKVRLGKYRNKLKKPIGEKGLRLSGGEQKRVGIARMLLKRPDLCLIDEATSDLDAVTEEVVAKTIGEITNGSTSISIAHRLATVKQADKIFVLENGKLTGAGTHEELVESSPLYQEMVELQKLN